MEPPENRPESGDSIDVGVDEPNVEQVVKTATSSDEVSRDVSSKTLEVRTSSSSDDATYALCLRSEPDLDANTGTKDVDHTGEVSLPIDVVKPVEFEVHSVEDRRSNASESTELDHTIGDADVIRNITDIEQDCNLSDPLEFARQVAIEVEREVVDCREDSSSSSDAAAPESVNQLPETIISAQLDLTNKPPSEEELSGGTLELREDEPASSAANATQEVECSRVCEFDLNQEVCVEKIVSAPAPEMPVSPFQFEVDNYSSKQPEHIGYIDLNIHDSLHEEPLTESNNNREPPVFKSSQRISEKPKLDLNCVTDDSDGESDIDLNDAPVATTTRSNESVISIMGVKVGVNKRDAAIPNPVPTLDMNSPPVFGYTYTGLSVAAAAAAGAMPYVSSGFFPYMFDPTVMAGTSTLEPVLTHPNFTMPGSHGVEPSGLNLDLSTGPGQRQSYNLMSNSQSQQTSNIVAGVKRREPDSGWETEHLLPFQLLQPTWK